MKLATIGYVAAGMMTLSGCLAMSVGPTQEAQDQAIFQCAKQLGDSVFPIKTNVSVQMSAGQQSTVVAIQPTDRLTERQAAAVNSCAAESLAASGLGIAEPLFDSAEPVVEPSAAPKSVAPQKAVRPICARGNGIMVLGTSYCVGNSSCDRPCPRRRRRVAKNARGRLKGQR